MRYLLAALLFISMNAFAQERFTGTIVYRVIVPPIMADNQDSASRLTVMFGANAMRITFQENKETDNEELLVLIDSGKVYALNMKGKTYSERTLMKTPDMGPLPPAKNILGYSATPHHLQYSSVQNRIFGDKGSNVSMFVADDLYYPIPEKYKHNNEFVLLYKDRIILEGKASLWFPFYGPYNDYAPENDLYISVSAISITKGQDNPDAYVLPPDFVEQEEYNFELDTGTVYVDSVWSIDTTAYLPDSVSIEPVKPAKPPAKKSSPSKKKTATKTVSPAKKPD